MSTSGGGDPAASLGLQFDKAERPAGTGRACGRCRGPITGLYYAAGKVFVCPTCATSLSASDGTASLWRAFGFGAGAAILGTLVWLLVMKITNSELGIVAIGVGLLVGLAVRKGAAGRGGTKYQALAVILTYVSITSSYVPLVLKGLSQAAKENAAEHGTEPSDATEPQAAPPAESKRASPGAGGVLLAVAIVFGLAFAAPFLGGAKNIMGIVIIGIALYEAWKVNRQTQTLLTGPYRVAAVPARAGATGPPQPSGPISPLGP